MKAQLFAINRVLTHQVEGRELIFSCIAGQVGAATVQLTVWGPNIVRCRFIAGSILRNTNSLSYVTGEPIPECPFAIDTSPRGIVLSTEALRTEVRFDPWQLCFQTSDGRLLTQEVHDDTDIAGTVLGPATGFEVEGDHIPPDRNAPARRVIRGFETLWLDPDEHFYGLGEKFTRLDKLGQTISMWQSNACGARTEWAYKNMPFVMTPRGYGLFVNSPLRVTFWLGSRSNRTYTIEVPGDAFEYFFIAGTMPEILEAYTRLTGRPSLPPKWSFGLWASTAFQPADDASVRARAQRLRAEGIPADVLHLDSYWQTQTSWSELMWDRKAFPDPEDLVQTLHAQHFRICLWENSYVSIHSSLFQEGVERGYFLTQSDGSVYTAQLWGGATASLCAIIDFSNPEAQAWFRGKHRPLLDMGIDTFKTDFGEAIPPDARFHNGRTGAEMRNLYGLLYQQLVFDLVRERYGQGIIWARAGCPGVQQFPTHWSGDPHATYEDMAATLRGGLSAGMSGLAFWSHDIGGFWGTPTPDLYIRWAQFGLLSTHSRYHGTTLRDPWEFGEQAVEIFRRYARLRYRLLPYLYSYAHVAAETGLPVMRPLVLHYPDDPATYGLDLQYLLGDELLIAPVFNPEGRVTVYLPKGQWTDFWTDEQHQGPVVLRRTVPLEIIPIFVRENSLLPLAPEMSFVGERKEDPLTVEVYLLHEATFTVQTEEGVIHLQARRQGNEVVFEASTAAFTFLVRLHGCINATAAEANGTPLPEFPDEQSLSGTPTGWTVGNRVVILKARTNRMRLTGCTFAW